MNTLFLTAITGECCLYVMCGIKPRGYNPFTLLRQALAKQGIVIKATAHLPLLLQLQHIYQENNLEPHRLLAKAIEQLSQKKDGQHVA